MLFSALYLVGNRDGHGRLFLSPCSSIFFLLVESVCPFPGFFQYKFRLSVIRTLTIPNGISLITAAKLLNRCRQITENCHHLLTTCKAEARQTHGDRAMSPSFANRNRSIDASKLSLEAQMECYFMLLEGEVGPFANGKTYLLAIFTFVHGAEGDRATSPSFASRNRSIDASKLSLKVQMQLYFMLLEGEVGHFAHRKKIHLLAIFTVVHGAEGNRATSPSFSPENKAIDASNSSLEVLIATGYMERECEREHFTHGKQSTCLQAERATRQRCPLFTVRYVAIKASSSLLEELIATLLPAGGTTNEAIF